MCFSRSHTSTERAQELIKFGLRSSEHCSKRGDAIVIGRCVLDVLRSEFIIIAARTTLQNDDLCTVKFLFNLRYVVIKIQRRGAPRLSEVSRCFFAKLAAVTTKISKDIKCIVMKSSDSVHPFYATTLLLPFVALTKF